MYRPDRRRVLGALSSLGVTAVAGCTDAADPILSDGDGSERSDGTGDSNNETGNDGTGPAELSVTGVDAPSWAVAGEPVTIRLSIENTGGTAGTFRDALINRSNDEELQPIDIEVPPATTAHWESDPIVRESVPPSGRLPLGSRDHNWSATVDIVERLSLGDEISFDGVSVRVGAVVRTDSYEYDVGRRRETLSAGEGQTFLFVYLTVDADSPASLGALPRRSAIGIEHEGEWIRAIRPSFLPAREPLLHGGRRLSRIDASDVPSGLAAYDPDVIEETATTPPGDRSLGGRDPIRLGQSSWVLVRVPEPVSMQDLSVLLSR